MLGKVDGNGVIDTGIALTIDDEGLFPAYSRYKGSITTALENYDMNFRITRVIDDSVIFEGTPVVNMEGTAWSVESDLIDEDLFIESTYILDVSANEQQASATASATRAYERLDKPLVLYYDVSSPESTNLYATVYGASGNVTVRVDDVTRQSENAFGTLNINTTNVGPNSTVKIYGNLGSIHIEHDPVDFIYDLVSFGDSALTNFQLGNNLRNVPTTLPSSVTSLNNAFNPSDNLNGTQPYFTGLDTHTWDVSNVSSFENTFGSCKSLASNFDHWDYSNAARIQNMFAGSNLSEGDFYFPLVTLAQGAFSHIRVGGILNIRYGIAHATSTQIDNLILEGDAHLTFTCDNVSEAQIFGYFSNSTFKPNSTLTFEVPNLTSMTSTFASSTFIGDVTLQIDVSNVVQRDNVFGQANTMEASSYTINQIDLINGTAF